MLNFVTYDFQIQLSRDRKKYVSTLRYGQAWQTNDADVLDVVSETRMFLCKDNKFRLVDHPTTYFEHLKLIKCLSLQTSEGQICNYY
jgi:hypothetical protein